jgi:predicted metal-dependent hydrolase
MTPYLVSTRIHRRAKRIILKIVSPSELQITLPPGINRSVIADIVEKNRNWIERAINKVRSNETVDIKNPVIPNQIALLAIGKIYPINLEFSLIPHVTISECDNNELKISGAIDQPLRVALGLRAWLKQKGQHLLPPWLNQISLQNNLPFKKAIVRLQRTRWGSCTSDHTINLNARLLLLEPDLVDYVLIHELCHTAHLNHSKRFWHLVAKHSPNYRVLDRALTLAGRQLPPWIRF